MYAQSARLFQVVPLALYPTPFEESSLLVVARIRALKLCTVSESVIVRVHLVEAAMYGVCGVLRAPRSDEVGPISDPVGIRADE